MAAGSIIQGCTQSSTFHVQSAGVLRRTAVPAANASGIGAVQGIFAPRSECCSMLHSAAISGACTALSRCGMPICCAAWQATNDRHRIIHPSTLEVRC
jgi:hypothetical protein